MNEKIFESITCVECGIKCDLDVFPLDGSLYACYSCSECGYWYETSAQSALKPAFKTRIFKNQFGQHVLLQNGTVWVF